MDVQLILSIISIALLGLLVMLFLFGKRKTDSGEMIALFKQNSEEQRNSVAKQLSDGTTEQFRRFSVIQDSVQKALQDGRRETNEQLGKLQTQLDNRLASIASGNAENLNSVNTTLASKIKELQESNEKRLEQMQGVVDEKLQKTLERRLTQSFEMVNKQLESVQHGLGEMRSLAADTKSLKNALMNVKARGTYGEVRLEKLLSDILAPNQYEENVVIADNKRVEFAVKLPGSGDAPLLLPIDSKFPTEDYNRLLDAEDKATIDEARKSLARNIRNFAKEIHEKYILPPKTTDFALMFLPTEGLYAEVVQNASLFEELRNTYKVTPVGATTLWAVLASLLIGFKTLALEEHSQKVWDTLREVKAEFETFGTALKKTQDQLRTADESLEKLVGTRTRVMNRKLKNIEAFSEEELLALPVTPDMEDIDDNEDE